MHEFLSPFHCTCTPVAEHPEQCERQPDVPMVDDTEVADRRAELPEPLPVVKQKKKWYRVCTMHLAVDFAELKEQLCVVPITRHD